MAVLSTLMVAFAASTALGSALPGRIGTPKSFAVNQVHNPNHVRHGPTELFRAYRKFGAPVPQSLHAIINATKAVAGSGSGSAVTTPEEYDVGIHNLAPSKPMLTPAVRVPDPRQHWHARSGPQPGFRHRLQRPLGLQLRDRQRPSQWPDAVQAWQQQHGQETVWRNLVHHVRRWQRIERRCLHRRCQRRRPDRDRPSR